MDKTKIYDASEIQDGLTKEILKDVASNLEEKGYDCVNQIVGYLLSGDLGYISSYKESRKKIQKIDRTKILETIVRDYLK